MDKVNTLIMQKRSIKEAEDRCQWSVVSKDYFDFIPPGVKTYEMPKTIVITPQQTKTTNNIL